MPARPFFTNRAKLFSIGRSQYVRLPDSMQFAGHTVVAKRMGNGVLLLHHEIDASQRKGSQQEVRTVSAVGDYHLARREVIQQVP